MPEPTRQFEPDPATPSTPEPDAAAAPIASDPSLHSVRASERLDAEETRRLVGAQLDVDLLVVVPFEPRPTTEPPKQLEHAPIPITPLFEEPHAQAPIAAVTLPSAGTVAEPPPSEIRPTVGAEPQHGFEPPEVAVLFLMENAAAAGDGAPAAEQAASSEETAPSRPEPPATAETVAVAPPRADEPPAPSSDESSAEPADFLLEPLPPPAVSNAPPAPAAPAPETTPPQRNDPLAALRALSSEERIALFT